MAGPKNKGFFLSDADFYRFTDGCSFHSLSHRLESDWKYALFLCFLMDASITKRTYPFSEYKTNYTPRTRLSNVEGTLVIGSLKKDNVYSHNNVQQRTPALLRYPSFFSRRSNPLISQRSEHWLLPRPGSLWSEGTSGMWSFHRSLSSWAL